MTWEAFLSDYERKLLETETALDDGSSLPDDVLQPFEAPQGLGPIPASLEKEALDILERTAALEQRLRNGVETLGRELGQATRMSGGAQRFAGRGDNFTPTYLDQSV